MNNENLRFKQFRKELKLNQTEFGKLVGLQQGSIADLERGKANISETIKKVLASEKNLNINWMETGEGEMFKLNSKRKELPESLKVENLDLMNLKDVLLMVKKLQEENSRLKDELLECYRKVQ